MYTNAYDPESECSSVNHDETGFALESPNYRTSSACFTHEVELCFASDLASDCLRHGSRKRLYLASPGDGNVSTDVNTNDDRSRQEPGEDEESHTLRMRDAGMIKNKNNAMQEQPKWRIFRQILCTGCC